VNRTKLAASALCVCIVFASGGALASTTTVSVDRLTLEGIDGTTFELGSRRYAGPLELATYPEGIAVVELVELDDYLGGIREVPFSWPSEALKAQAVAARTYLAWTMVRGRVGDQSRHDYDICATTACQVYVGAGAAQLADGDRWLAAVERTAGEVLLYEGAPAQTLYSSSAGSRTRANQDIWGGDPKAYLQPVDSPEAGVTPYESWTVEFPIDTFAEILQAAGYEIGAKIRSVRVASPPEGRGPTHVVVTGSSGTASIRVDRFRAVFNAYAPGLYPARYPAFRSPGKRWPQAVLSYTFDLSFERSSDRLTPVAVDLLLPEDVSPLSRVVVTGEGWGHGIGMSQWGAKAMADAGATYDAILAHYYGGLTPGDGGANVPDRVRVGLAVEQANVDVIADGPFRVLADGEPLAVLPAGAWSFPVTQQVIEILLRLGLPLIRIDIAPGLPE